MATQCQNAPALKSIIAYSLRGDTVLVGPDGTDEDFALHSAFLSHPEDILRAIFLNRFHLFRRGDEQSNHGYDG